MSAKKFYKSAVAAAEALSAALSRPAARYTSDNGVLVAPDGRSWDYSPFGQSIAARRGRMERRFMRVNAWKVQAGIWSRKGLQANARLHARWNVTAENLYGAKYIFRAATGEESLGFNIA